MQLKHLNRRTGWPCRTNSCTALTTMYLCESPVREIRTLGLSGGRRPACTIGRLLRPDTGMFFFLGRAEHRDAEGVSRLSSSQDEHGRPNASWDRGTAVQTKWVKPVGVVQRVEPSSARDRRKSSARISVLLSMNRRMRTRMSGGVRGGVATRGRLSN
jgi:hypothetical protein